MNWKASLYQAEKKDIIQKLGFKTDVHSFLLSDWLAKCLIQECPKTRIIIEWRLLKIQIKVTI